jgi:hypothetical protein
LLANNCSFEVISMGCGLLRGEHELIVEREFYAHLNPIRHSLENSVRSSETLIKCKKCHRKWSLSGKELTGKNELLPIEEVAATCFNITFRGPSPIEGMTEWAEKYVYDVICCLVFSNPQIYVNIVNRVPNSLTSEILNKTINLVEKGPLKSLGAEKPNVEETRLIEIIEKQIQRLHNL